MAPTEEWVKLTPEEYIYRWRATAVDNMEVYGIPASITMAQAILESGFGNGYLARVAENAKPHISSTPLGIAKEVIFSFCLNAKLPIDFTPAGNTLVSSAATTLPVLL